MDDESRLFLAFQNVKQYAPRQKQHKTEQTLADLQAVVAIFHTSRMKNEGWSPTD